MKLLEVSESESEYAASAYGYDTGSESDKSTRSHSSTSSMKISKKQFKPSSKKRIQLTFQNLSVKSVAKRKNFLCCEYGPVTPQKIILDNVSGTVLPEQFVAILGTSGNKSYSKDILGSGKTTFLNFLSGRTVGLGNSLTMSGKVLLNGKDRDRMPGSEALTCYVQQDDILFQTMTVRECLMFAAFLKLKGTMEEKAERVDEIIKDLRLHKCQNTKIGGSLFKGISGGERKRTNIGVELVTDPQLIFLDEPTTGLDSHTAASVMETLRALARSGRTVVSSIHQPSSEIFDNFDRLLLIAQGKIVYFNEAHLSVDYFTSIGYTVPDLCNPADHYMTMISAENPNETEIDGRQKTEAECLRDYSKKIAYLCD